jgi:hypothetical protein
VRLRKGLWLVHDQIESGACPDKKGKPEHDHETVVDPAIEPWETEKKGNQEKGCNEMVDFGDGHHGREFT